MKNRDMADDLFEGLPPPSSTALNNQPQPQPILSDSSSLPSAPKPILKSSLKRPNPTQSDNTQGSKQLTPINSSIQFFLFLKP